MQTGADTDADTRFRDIDTAAGLDIVGLDEVVDRRVHDDDVDVVVVVLSRSNTFFRIEGASESRRNLVFGGHFELRRQFAIDLLGSPCGKNLYLCGTGHVAKQQGAGSGDQRSGFHGNSPPLIFALLEANP
jgi:hypothetical protein